MAESNLAYTLSTQRFAKYTACEECFIVGLLQLALLGYSLREEQDEQDGTETNSKST